MMQVYKCVRQGVQDVAVKIVFGSSSGDVAQLQDFKRVSLLAPVGLDGPEPPCCIPHIAKALPALNLSAPQRSACCDAAWSGSSLPT